VRGRRLEQPSNLADRLKEEANKLRRQAQGMPSGVRRDELLRKARQAETAARLNELVETPDLNSPK
jgi:hypothetical protein